MLKHLYSALPDIRLTMERISISFSISLGMGVQQSPETSASQARGWNGYIVRRDSLIWNGIGTETAIQYIEPQFYKLQILNDLTKETYIVDI